MQGSSKPLMGVRFSHGLPILLFSISAYGYYPEGIQNYIPDFPELQQTIEYVDDIATECRIASNTSSDKILGCSKISFDKGICRILLPRNYRYWVLQHEKAHCIGGDHNNMLLKEFNKYKETIGR